MSMTLAEKSLILLSIQKQNKKIKKLEEDYKEMYDLVVTMSNKIIGDRFGEVEK